MHLSRLAESIQHLDHIRIQSKLDYWKLRAHSLRLRDLEKRSIQLLIRSRVTRENLRETCQRIEDYERSLRPFQKRLS